MTHAKRSEGPGGALPVKMMSPPPPRVLGWPVLQVAWGTLGSPCTRGGRTAREGKGNDRWQWSAWLGQARRAGGACVHQHSLNTRNPDIQQMEGSGLEFTEHGTVRAFSGWADTRFQKQQALGASQHLPALPPSGSHREIPEDRKPQGSPHCDLQVTNCLKSLLFPSCFSQTPCSN